jgi:hypothetical protein
MKKDEYKNVLAECVKIVLKVYDLNRNENKFNKGTIFEKYSRFVYFACAATVLSILVSEVFESETDVYNWYYSTVAISMLLVVIASLLNFFQEPDENIFVGYEEFLHNSIKVYFQELNKTLKNGVQFGVSKNDVNWIEIYIPKKL